jgi:hypothetical protein
MAWFRGLRSFIGKLAGHAKTFIGKYGPKVVKAISEARVTGGFPPAVQNVLVQCGGDEIRSIKVCRTPVSERTENMLKMISGSAWDRLKREQGFDKFFHLFMVLDVGGKLLHLEKNELIHLAYYPSPCEDGMDVPLNRAETLNEFMANTRAYMGDKRYFEYDALVNNCQVFVKSNLEANGLLTPQLNKFIYQDLSGLIAGLPSHVAPLSKALTDVAGMVNTAIQNSVIGNNAQTGGTENPPDAS